MTYREDRELARVYRRLDMMLARGVINTVDDGAAMQTMQLDILADEVTDDCERYQSYGISSVPLAGSEVVAAFIGGNRDQPVVLAVNHRGSRPMGLKGGEVCLYSNQDCAVLLNEEGTITMKSENATVTMTREGDIKLQSDKSIEIEAGERITLRAPAVEINP